jgi:hypothetical protein
MNANRSPDGRIRAWLDLMPDEAPDRAVANVLQAIESTPQVRRPLVPAMRRLPPMNRLSLAAAAAVTIVAVLAGAAIFSRPSSNVGGPPTPSPSPVASTTPAFAPEALRATWLADAGPSASPGAAGSMIRLVVSGAGDTVSVLDGGVETFASRAVAGQSDELDITSSASTDGCQIGDLGRYRFAFGADGTVPGSDGTLLSLTVVADGCAARMAMLNRTWVHAIDTTSAGGRGVAAAFAPMFLITLPPAAYGSEVGGDSLTLTSGIPDRTLIAVRNPVGWSDPCSVGGGAKRPIAPTISAFTAYMGTLPGFTVHSSNLQIDGRPAVRLMVPSVLTTDCPTHRVNEWSAGAVTGPGGWLLNQGETDVLYLVEVSGNLILLQWLGTGVTAAEEQALLATMRFTEALPQ